VFREFSAGHVSEGTPHWKLVEGKWLYTNHEMSFLVAVGATESTINREASLQGRCLEK